MSIANILPDKIFVTGIGTGIGKTIISAKLCFDLGYDYWKPVQSGDLHQTDSMTVAQLVPGLRIWPERFRLNTPISPHASAAMDGVEINLEDFQIPDTEKLIVEGAGGLMVPLNDRDLMIDLIIYLKLPVVLVVRDYLGCINHTILSIEALENRNIEIAAIIFNGNFDQTTLEYLSQRYKKYPRFLQPEAEI